MLATLLEINNYSNERDGRTRLKAKYERETNQCSWRIEKAKMAFFLSPSRNSSVTRNWKRGSAKKTRLALGAFIFLVYRPRGALDNVRFPRWKWLQYGRHPVDVDVRTRATCAQKRACKWSAASERLAQKLSVCTMGKKKERKKERKKKRRASYGLIGGNSSHWIGKKLEKNSDRIAPFRSNGRVY